MISDPLAQQLLGAVKQIAIEKGMELFVKGIGLAEARIFGAISGKPTDAQIFEWLHERQLEAEAAAPAEPLVDEPEEDDGA